MYNYLFYKSYQLGRASSNYDDMPVLGGIVFVCLCFMLNVFTLLFLIEGAGIQKITMPDERFRFIIALGLIGLFVAFYQYGNRYERVISYYEARERKAGIGLHPILVIAAYYVGSFLVMLVAGLYKNKDWIFAE